MAAQVPHRPLLDIWEEVPTSLNQGRPHVAIHLALSMPDICSSLETKQEDDLRWKVMKRYVAWCQNYLEPEFNHFTAMDCWALRSGLLHNGMMFGHPKSQYDRIMFTMSDNFVIGELLSRNNGGTTETVLSMDARVFCKRMGLAIQKWVTAMEGNEVVLDNYDALVRLRMDGLPPHIVGMPVIA